MEILLLAAIADVPILFNGKFLLRKSHMQELLFRFLNGTGDFISENRPAANRKRR